MPSHVQSYNVDILAHSCPKCGVPPLERCRGAIGYVTLCHDARLALAGYRWSPKLGLIPREGK
jgi:hypothetical protein